MADIKKILGFDGSVYYILDASAMSSVSISGKTFTGYLRSGSSFSVTLPAASVTIGTSNLAWNTTSTLATVEGTAIKATLPKTIDGWRVQGSGINSLMNNTNGVGINPAANGLGYNTKNGTTTTGKTGALAKIYMTRSGVEFEFVNTDGYINQANLQYLFDGKNGTNIQLTVPSVFINSTGLAAYNYSASKAYAVGDFARYTTANVTTSGGSDYAWYRCIQATTGNAPSGAVSTDNTYWEYMSCPSGSYYAGINPMKLESVRMRLYLTTSIAYENGISIYWRTSGLHPSNVKIRKVKGDESDYNGNFMPSTSGVSIGEATVTSIYFNLGASTTNDNKILDFVFTGFSMNNTWQIVPTQLAFTGNVGSLEGTLVNRGGGTGAAMYGDFLPYKTDTVNLGNASYRWNNILVKTINGATATFSPPSHTHSVTLSGEHKHNIPTISGGSHKHTFSIANTVTNHSHSVNDPGHTHSISELTFTYDGDECLDFSLLTVNTNTKTTGITVSASSFSVTNASTSNTSITISNVSTANATVSLSGTTSAASA